MLHAISWQVYLIYLTVMLVIYYVILILVFSRQNLKGIPKPFTAMDKSNVANAETSARYASNLSTKESRDVLYNVVHDAVDEIQAYLTGVKNTVSKDVVFESIKKIVNKYNALKAGTFRSSINDFIVITCENCSSIKLSVEDMRAVWDDDGAVSQPPQLEEAARD